MILTIFRKWNRPDMDVAAEAAQAAQLYIIAYHMPGFVSAKEYRATEGEVLFLVSFETAADMERWREHPDHLAAKRRWAEFYSGYGIQLAEVKAEYGPGPGDFATSE